MSAATRPPSGTRDFLPAELIARREVMRKIEAAYEAAGFLPIETPSFERVETLMGKYGDEGDQLIFRILKRGDKLSDALDSSEPAPDAKLSEVVSANELADHALRYDLTVPFARVVAANRATLPRHFKRYQIQPVWRADRPQRGRFREFMQCDVDYIGTDSCIAEWEVLSAAGAALSSVGFQKVRCRLNDRRLLAALLRTAEVPDELQGDVLIALDKEDKIGADGVVGEWQRLGLEPGVIAKLKEITLAQSSQTNAATLDMLAEAFKDDPEGAAGVETLRELLAYDAAATTHLSLEVDLGLVRGLSYYTGPIFELTLPGFAGSVGGGGRYDGLIGMFAGTQIPAVGISLGFERLMVLLEERTRSESAPPVDVFATRLHPAADGALLALVRSLRDAGLSVHLFPNATALRRQLKQAADSGAKHALLIGEDEAAAGEVTIRDLQTGEQTRAPYADALNILTDRAQ